MVDLGTGQLTSHSMNIIEIDLIVSNVAVRGRVIFFKNWVPYQA